MLCLSEKIFLLEQPSPIFPFATYSWDSELNTPTTIYSSSDQPTSSAKAQGPIYNFGSLSLQEYINIYIINYHSIRISKKCVLLLFTCAFVFFIKRLGLRFFCCGLFLIKIFFNLYICIYRKRKFISIFFKIY